MITTTIRRRIEVLLDLPLVPALARLAAEAGIAHYTLLPTLGGVGHSGRWRDDQLSGATAKVMFLALATHHSAERLVELLSPLLEPQGLVLFISDAEVVRAGRFA